MSISDVANSVYNAFYKYAKGQESKWESFKLPALKRTLVEFAKDNESGAYIAIKHRVEELEKKL